MKRILSFILASIMMMTVAFADEGAENQKTIYVKYGAVSMRDAVWQALRDDGVPEDVNLPTPPGAPSKDFSVVCGDTRYNCILVYPTFTAKDAPTINADSEYNTTRNELLKYAVRQLEVTQTNRAYDNAYGEAPEWEISNPHIDPMWDEKGGNYTLTYEYMGATFTQGLRVNSVESQVPEVSISDTGIVSCSPATVEFSEDLKSWNRVNDGRELSDKYWGKHLYFRTPATGSLEASDTIKIYVKEKQNPPTGKIQVEATSFSLTITNANEFKGCVFSLDDGSWSSRTTFTNLKPNTRYTIKARYPGNSSEFPSTAIQVNATTLEGPKNGITYDKVATSDTIYFTAEGTSALTVTNKTLTGEYTESDLKSLKNDIKTQERHMTAVTTMDIHMVQEANDDRVYDKIKFTLPGDMGLLQLRLHTPYFSVIRDTETKSILITDGQPTGNITFGKGQKHVYQVNINNNPKGGAGRTKIAFPWEFPDRTDLDGLKVHYADMKGENVQELPYSCGGDAIYFTLPANGYFYIENLNRPYPSIPFVDAQTGWAYSYICHAYETGLVAGTSATTFSPDAKVSRAQLCVLLCAMDPDYIYGRVYSQMPYTDIEEGSWFYSQVSYLYYKGVLKPDSDKFEPGATVSRADTAAMIDKVFTYSGVLWTPFNCKDRDQIPTYALKAVDSLYTNGVMSGTGADTFSPTSTLTRAEIVTILYRLQTNTYWRNISLYAA